MPYVKQERRPDLDPIVKKMVAIELTTSDIVSFLTNLPIGSYKGFVLTDRFQPVLEAIKIAGVKPNGDINYILFKYGKYHIKPSYNNYKAYIGAIHKAICNLEIYGSTDYIDEYRESAAEIRRRILAKYEDEKIEENGDV
ncbi:hypothetical protein LCGC14_1249490 [marine sediment metagenome]|uniref:Uncharacterized protein n=1 Tax=marine sediment metagenome TaxID=412755 RepID=A0A0F9L3D1_9ZZZZ